jgi:hypothetical protein
MPHVDTSTRRATLGSSVATAGDGQRPPSQGAPLQDVARATIGRAEVVLERDVRTAAMELVRRILLEESARRQASRPRRGRGATRSRRWQGRRTTELVGASSGSGGNDARPGRSADIDFARGDGHPAGDVRMVSTTDGGGEVIVAVEGFDGGAAGPTLDDLDGWEEPEEVDTLGAAASRALPDTGLTFACDALGGGDRESTGATIAALLVELTEAPSELEDLVDVADLARSAELSRERETVEPLPWVHPPWEGGHYGALCDLFPREVAAALNVSRDRRPAFASLYRGVNSVLRRVCIQAAELLNEEGGGPRGSG